MNSSNTKKNRLWKREEQIWAATKEPYKMQEIRRIDNLVTNLILLLETNNF